MMVPIPPLVMPQPVAKPTLQTSSAKDVDSATATGAHNDALRAAASDFEAAFIAQMLTHSGLADALTSGEGQMASAFGSFFVEELAGEIAAMGGMGLADSIYKQLERYEAGESS